MHFWRTLDFIPILTLAAWAQPGPAPARPAYLELRWDENWSYLRNHTYRTDYLDPLKYIELGHPGWYMSLGGESRTRYELFRSAGFGAVANSPNGSRALVPSPKISLRSTRASWSLRLRAMRKRQSLFASGVRNWSLARGTFCPRQRSSTFADPSTLRVFTGSRVTTLGTFWSRVLSNLIPGCSTIPWTTTKAFGLVVCSDRIRSLRKPTSRSTT